MSWCFAAATPPEIRYIGICVNLRRRSLVSVLAGGISCACSTSLQGVPAFQGRSLEGIRFSRDSLKGRPVLIQFWATWCGYCRRDQPALDSLAYQFLGRLHVIAVNVGEPAGVVRQYLATAPRRGQIVLSEDTDLPSVFHPAGFPYYVLLSDNSELLGVQRGSAGEEGLRRLLKKAAL